jgi:G3E family GTPase
MKNSKERVTIYLAGGFLGSGKTTAIINACRHLISAGKKAAVITNDQGDQQVDSGYLRGLLVPNAEVANGCFCCNYDALEKHILHFNESVLPEIIFAESVGSCTDLVATIAKPFALFHPELRIVISVFADAPLLYSIATGTSCFIEESVRYIYQKQLEEADILVMNKTDLLSVNELNGLKEFISNTYEGKTILYQDSYNENDIQKWLSTAGKFHIPRSRQSLDLDYDIYGAGEAALAWLDKAIFINTANPVAVNTAIRLAENIYNKIRKAGYTIGHLKFLLDDSEGWITKISYTSGGRRNDDSASLHNTRHVSFLINARVQTTPEVLQELVTAAIHEIMMETGCRITTGKENSFVPGYPKPVHRIAK